MFYHFYRKLCLKMRETYSKKEKLLTSNFMLASFLMFLVGIFTLISFLSPYWIKTNVLLDHELTNMGVWQVCFNDFQNIQINNNQYFDGCKLILSNEMYNLRNWFLPNWLRGIQILFALNFVLTFSILFLILVSIFNRLKQKFSFIIFITILIILQGMHF